MRHRSEGGTRTTRRTGTKSRRPMGLPRVKGSPVGIAAHRNARRAQEAAKAAQSQAAERKAAA